MENQNNTANNNFSMQNEINLQNQIKNGLNWFYWIGGLSIINSILFFTNTNLSFIAGLGITQFVDSFFKERPNASHIGFILNSFFIVLFIVFGRFGKKSTIVVVIGIIIYSFDSLIFLFVKDWLSLGFHIFALIGIFTGLRAKIKLSKYIYQIPVSEINNENTVKIIEDKNNNI